jgi:hypothetical protein
VVTGQDGRSQNVTPHHIFCKSQLSFSCGTVAKA